MNNALICATNIEIHFGGIRAADGVNLSVYEGDRLAIIGPNGAGKTTFLNICTGYLKPNAGKVSFDGKEITARSPREITRLGIARTFQIPQLFLEHTVLENALISLAARHRRMTSLAPLLKIPERDAAMHLLELFRIEHVANQPAHTLPEGMRKLLDIALGLALKPKVLLMDEPTSGVSSQEKFEIMDILAKALDEHSVTAVFVEHDMDVVSRYAGRVAVWDLGKILIEGSPDNVLSHPEVIDRVIGMGGSHAAV